MKLTSVLMLHMLTRVRSGTRVRPRGRRRVEDGVKTLERADDPLLALSSHARPFSTGMKVLSFGNSVHPPPSLLSFHMCPWTIDFALEI
jgi:hypothetical protein